MQTDRKVPHREIAGGLTGILALVLVYLGQMSPLAYYLLVFPALLFALAWGWRGGGLAALGLILSTLPAVLQQQGLWLDWGLASALTLTVALVSGWLAERRRQAAQLTATFTETAQRWRTFTTADVTEWRQLILNDLLETLSADAGAWTWGAPVPRVLSAGAVTWEAQAWQDIAAGAAPPDRAYFPLIIPASDVADLNALILVRRRAFSPAEQSLAQLLVTLAQQQLVITLQRQQSDAQLARQLQEMETLQQVTWLVGESLDLDKTLQAVLEALQHLVLYDVGEITLWQPEEEVMARRAIVGDARALAYLQQVEGTYRLDEGLTGRLASQRRPLLIDDLHAIETVKPKVAGPEVPMRAYLGIPLLTRGELVGTLEIASYNVARFSEHELELLQTFGAQAALAIEKARLYHDAAQRVQLLERLQQATQAVSRAEDLQTLSAEIVSHVTALVDAEIAGLLLFDTSREALVACPPWQGLPDEWVQNYAIPLPAGSRRAQRLREHPYWLIENAQTDDDVESLGLQSLAVAVNMRQTLLVPLESGDERMGFIQVANPSLGQRFDAEDIQLLTMLGSQISGTVRFSQLLERMTQRSRLMESLASVASAIGGSLDLEEVLASIVRSVSSVMQCQRTAIFVLDPHTQLLSLVAAEGVSDQYRRGSQEIPVIEGGRAHAVAVNQMVISEDILSLPDEVAAVAPLAAVEGFRAFADVPLQRGERAVGLLSAQFADQHHFTEDELNFLSILAEQAAVAIENARLYTQTDAELRRRVDSLEALQRVTQEITATLDLNHILRVVLSEALHFAGTETGFIVLWDGKQAELRSTQGYDDAAYTALQALLAAPQESALMSEFIQREESLYAPDLLEDYGALQLGELQLRSLLATPVFYEERLAAAIVLHSDVADAFETTVQEFVEGLAVQTSIAVGNARRYEEQIQRGELMHQRAEQMGLLLEVTRTMRSDRPLEEVLLDVSYAIQEATGYDIVLISILEEGYQRRIAGAGIPLAQLDRLRQVRQPWAQVEALFRDQFRLGRSYYIPAEYRHLRSKLDVFEPEGAAVDVGREPGEWHPQDMLLMPLRNTQGDVIGMISLDQPRDLRAPTALSMEVPELFGAQVALAIENNQLVENLRLQLNTLQLFNELSRSITTKLDLKLVLNTVAQSVTNLLDYDYSTIYLMDQERGRLVPQASSGYALEMLHDQSFALGEGLVGRVAQTGMPLVCEDIVNEPGFTPGPLALASSIMVPLTAEGRSLGVLTADRKQHSEFSPKDVATFTALADQVSVGVENARLFEEVSRFSQELEQRVEERTRELAAALEDLQTARDRATLLYRIASELVSSLDIDRVLNKALEMLRDAADATVGAIVLLDSDTGHLICRAAIGRTTPVPPGGQRLPFGRDEGLVGWVLQNQESLVLPDVTQDPRWIPLEPELDIHSVLAAPIVTSAGEAQGVILLQSPEVQAFDERSLRLLDAAAVQLGNALNNAELYRLIREQAERLGTMLRTQQIEAAKNQAILEGIADGVMVADANGRVILFNAAAERIFSVSRGQALGRFLDDMLGLYGKQARAWLEQVEAWRKSPQNYEAGEFLSERLDLEDSVVSIHLSPVFSPSNEFLGAVSVFRDITTEVRAEEAKNEFVSTVSHELRTPMTSIKGYVDLLLMGTTGELTELQTNFLKVVKSNADRLASLVNDLLDISRIETGRIELQLQPVEMGDLIEQAVTSLTPKAEEKGLQLAHMLPAYLPKVYGDPDRLTQILTNLIGNAYKYTPTGGSVTVHGYVREGMFHVAVADTGIGISKEDQRQIFERFFRVDDPTVHEMAGTGLGLAITVSLVHLHGGEIWVESELGEGSIFFSSFPLAEGESTADVGKPPLGFARPDFTVLVVEDDVEIAEMIRVALENEGRKVLVSHSGEEALHLAREHHPDMISLDIRLPDLDGFEVLELLKRDVETADIPVVVVSVVPDAERGLRLGAVDYLTKPVDQEILLRAVDRCLAQREVVLVVDDDKETQQLLRTALRARGLTVRATRQGDRALRLAQELHPGLILLDLKLPGMDGFAVLEQLKGNTRTADIPVIVMTGSFSETEGKAQAVEALGALRFLTKPFSVEELAEEISHLVDGKDPQKELGA